MDERLRGLPVVGRADAGAKREQERYERRGLAADDARGVRARLLLLQSLDPGDDAVLAVGEAAYAVVARGAERAAAAAALHDRAVRQVICAIHQACCQLLSPP